MRLRGFAAVVVIVALAGTGCAQGSDIQPTCRGNDRVFVLAAQAVPSATLLPCVAQLPVGWAVEGARTVDGRFWFFLSSDRAGIRAVEVSLTDGCDVSDAVQVLAAEDEVGTRRYEEPIALGRRLVANRYYTYPGGCTTYAFRFTGPAGTPAMVLEVDGALSFRPRQPLVAELAERGLVLCGAGAPPCPGGE